MNISKNILNIRKLLALVLFTFFTSVCFNSIAQNQQTTVERLNQLKAKKVAFLSQRMQLTPDEAQVFWPVYNEFVSKKDNLNKEQKELSRRIQTNQSGLSDKQMEEIADGIIAIRLKHAHLETEYHEKFKSVLPISKVLLLYQSENQFKSELIRQIKEQQLSRQESEFPKRKN